MKNNFFLKTVAYVTSAAMIFCSMPSLELGMFRVARADELNGGASGDQGTVDPLQIPTETPTPTAEPTPADTEPPTVTVAVHFNNEDEDKDEDKKMKKIGNTYYVLEDTQLDFSVSDDSGKIMEISSFTDGDEAPVKYPCDKTGTYDTTELIKYDTIFTFSDAAGNHTDISVKVVEKFAPIFNFLSETNTAPLFGFDGDNFYAPKGEWSFKVFYMGADISDAADKTENSEKNDEENKLTVSVKEVMYSQDIDGEHSTPTSISLEYDDKTNLYTLSIPGAGTDFWSVTSFELVAEDYFGTTTQKVICTPDVVLQDKDSSVVTFNENDPEEYWYNNNNNKNGITFSVENKDHVSTSEIHEQKYFVVETKKGDQLVCDKFDIQTTDISVKYSLVSDVLTKELNIDTEWNKDNIPITSHYDSDNMPIWYFCLNAEYIKSISKGVKKDNGEWKPEYIDLYFINEAGIHSRSLRINFDTKGPELSFSDDAWMSNNEYYVPGSGIIINVKDDHLFKKEKHTFKYNVYFDHNDEPRADDYSSESKITFGNELFSHEYMKVIVYDYLGNSSEISCKIAAQVPTFSMESGLCKKLKKDVDNESDEYVFYNGDIKFNINTKFQPLSNITLRIRKSDEEEYTEYNYEAALPKDVSTDSEPCSLICEPVNDKVDLVLLDYEHAPEGDDYNYSFQLKPSADSADDLFSKEDYSFEIEATDGANNAMKSTALLPDSFVPTITAYNMDELVYFRADNDEYYFKDHFDFLIDNDINILQIKGENLQKKTSIEGKKFVSYWSLDKNDKVDIIDELGKKTTLEFYRDCYQPFSVELEGIQTVSSDSYLYFTVSDENKIASGVRSIECISGTTKINVEDGGYSADEKKLYKVRAPKISNSDNIGRIDIKITDNVNNSQNYTITVVLKNPTFKLTNDSGKVYEKDPKNSWNEAGAIWLQKEESEYSISVSDDAEGLSMYYLFSDEVLNDKSNIQINDSSFFISDPKADKVVDPITFQRVDFDTEYTASFESGEGKYLYLICNYWDLPGFNYLLKRYEINVDNSAPEIEFIYSAENQHVGDDQMTYYYSEKTSLKVKVESDVLDETSCSFSYLSDGSPFPGIDKGEKEGEYCRSYSFEQDGRYEFEFSCSSLSGVPGVYSGNKKAIVIDTVAPEIQIKSPEGMINDGIKYIKNVNQQIWVDINDINLDPNEVVITINEEDISLPLVSTDENGYHYKWPIPKEDSSFSFEVKAYDYSDNYNSKSLIPMVVDTKNPDLIVDYAESSNTYVNTYGDRVFYNGQSRIKITVDDDNLDLDSIEINDPDSDIPLKPSRGSNSCEVDLNEGEYQFHVTAKDKADNKLDKNTDTLIVDKDAPTIGIDSIGQYHSDSFEIHFHVTDKYFDETESYHFRSDIKNLNVYLVDLNDPSNKPIDVTSEVRLNSADRNNNTYEYIYTATNEGEYKLHIEAYDMAGNRVFWDTENFVIDRTAPSIRYDFGAATSNVNDTLYYNSASAVTVTISDDYFDPNSVSFHIYNENGVQRKISVPNRSNDGKNYIYIIELNSSEKRAQIHAECKDFAGNSDSKDSGYYVFDNVKPTGKIDVGNLGSWDSLQQNTSFDLFSKNEQAVSVSASDDNAQVKSVLYYTSRQSYTLATDVERNGSWMAYNGSFGLAKNSKNIVYVKITDNAENVTYLSSAGVIIDDMINKPVIDIKANQSAEGFWNKDVPIHVTITDPVINDTCSGIKLVTYQLKNGDNVVESKSIDGFNPQQSSYEFDLVLDSQKFNSNDVEVVVTVEDNVGNKEEVNKLLSIDAMAPVIDFEITQESADGYYYGKASDCIATVTIYERNFDKDKVEFDIPGKYELSWQIAGDGKNDKAANVATIRFKEDGIYTIGVKCSDAANNSSEYKMEHEFIVDKSVPDIQFRFDDKIAPANENYYNADKEIVLKITEHNFDPNLVTISAVGVDLKDGQEFNVDLSKTKWETKGDVHQLTFKVDREAEYNIKVSAKDKALNSDVSSIERKFFIDKEAPEIKVFVNGMDLTKEKNTAYALESVIPSIQISDNYRLDETKLNVSIESYLVDKNGELAAPEASRKMNAVFEEYVNMEKWLYSNIEEDGIYLVKVSAKDMSGNIAADFEEAFSVNRNGSIFFLEENSDSFRLVDDVTRNTPIDFDFVIYERNVDSISNASLTISSTNHGAVVMDADPNVSAGDYYFSDGTEEGSFKFHAIEHRISSSMFKEEDHYTISVISTDKAGNKNSSQTQNNAKPESYDFYYDVTSPKLMFEGISNGRYNLDSLEFRIDTNTADLTGVVKVQVTVDGKTMVYGFDKDSEKKIEADGIIPIILSGKSVYQTVKVKAWDAAGNESDEYTYRVLVTTNLFWQLFYNRPIFFGGIGAVVVAAGASLFLIFKKRKKKLNK